MTPIEKLDAVLNYLAAQFPLYASYTDGYIFSGVRGLCPELEEQNDFGGELVEIFKKLHKDGFLEIDKHDRNNPLPHELDRYNITFEGVYFIKHQDGYRGRDLQRLQKSLDVQKADNTATRLADLTGNLSTWTKRLFLGTVIVGLVLFLWDVTKFLIEHCGCHR